MFETPIFMVIEKSQMKEGLPKKNKSLRPALYGGYLDISNDYTINDRNRRLP